KKEVLAGITELRNSMLVTSLLVIIMGIALVWFVSRIVVKPIVVATEHAKIISNGDLSNDIPEEFLNQKDEIGTLSLALHNMVINLRNIIASITNSSENITAASQQLTEAGQNIASTMEEVSAST